MDVNIIIEEYIKHMQALNYAKKTIELYHWGLMCFAAFLASINIINFRQVTRKIIYAYQSMITDEPIAAETRAIKIRAVKRLFEYLTENHRLLINPTDGIVEVSRKHRKIGTVLTMKEINLLLEQPNLSLPMQIRDRAIMEVLYSTAIRADELLKLTVYDPDLNDNLLYVRKGKGGNDRVVPLHENAAGFLEEYLKKIRPQQPKSKKESERTLFLKKTGQPFTHGALTSSLRLYRIKAGINKNVTAHTFRRTCATHMLQQGSDIRYIQKLLGHKHLKTTQQYTKVVPLDIKRTHNKTHPNHERGKKEKRETKENED
jgi:integrase/recombinase XerD